ncbi:twin-arginine translocase TatA/TatE family subunit [Candidatus Poribacteria bacterium]|nr:twin-arginine translocase TatA/TatE family subunit [Candidatus Poribacteria bacterium]
MGALGGWEIIVILIVVLVVFGPKRLPEMGRSLGKAIREFKSAGKEIQQEVTEAIDGDSDSTKPANKKLS